MSTGEDVTAAAADLPRDDLLHLLRLAAALTAPGAPGPLLEQLLDAALALTGAARGRLDVGRGLGAVPALAALPAEERVEHPTAPLEELDLHAARGATPVGDDPELRRAARAAFACGQPTFLAGVPDPQAEGRVRAVASVPLRRGALTLGVLSVERAGPRPFDARDRALLLALTGLGAGALEASLSSARLEEAYRESRRELDARAAAASGLLGGSRELRRVKQLIQRVAAHDAAVLIEGETGTGKELVARAIHAASPRRAGPFVVESCAALPDGLAEAELFGHVAGAFTGALEARPGMFERARGGTLFLDDVGEASARLQGLLLRVLEVGEVRPLGAPAPRRVDCRVIASTRTSLDELVRAGRLRDDLRFRLGVVRIALPPLRERKQDLPALVSAFLRELGRPSSALSPRGLEAVLLHDWPGNVRELRHALERAVLLAGDRPLDASHLGLRLPGDVGEGEQVVGKVALGAVTLNRRQLTLVEYLRANGVATNREYVRMVGVSVPTGWRDLRDLLAKDVVRADGDGRNTVYRLTGWAERAAEQRPPG